MNGMCICIFLRMLELYWVPNWCQEVYLGQHLIIYMLDVQAEILTFTNMY